MFIRGNPDSLRVIRPVRNKRRRTCVYVIGLATVRILRTAICVRQARACVCDRHDGRRLEKEAPLFSRSRGAGWLAAI